MTILKIIAIIFGIIGFVSAFTLVLIITQVSQKDIENSPTDTKLNDNKKT